MTARRLFPALCLTLITIASQATAAGTAPSQAEVHEAQKAWGAAIVEIGKANTYGGNAKAAAKDVVDRLYAFQHGDVLFKPTLSADQQFRLNAEDALSYFVGGHIKEDTGFAIKPWNAVRFENATVQEFDGITLAMGNYFFTCTENNTIKVEYTKGYVKDADGTVRIVLQHSSLPYSPAPAAALETVSISE